MISSSMNFRFYSSLLFAVKKNCQELQTVNRTGNITISCDPGEKYESKVQMFFCKESGSICEDILKSPLKSNRTFTLIETESGFNVSITDVTSQHAGVYWCGVEEEGRYRASFRRIQLEVKGEKRSIIYMNIYTFFPPSDHHKYLI